MGTLSLMAPRRADVPKAHAAVREALRLAHMPGEGRPGRLFIRRIELPPLRLSEGAHRLAGWLGEHIRDLRRRAVAIDAPAAAVADADAVIARDELEPWLVALVHASRGQRLSAWFWPRVDAELTPSTPHNQVVLRAWSRLSARPEAPQLLVEVVGLLLDSELLEAALAPVDHGTAREIGQGIGVAVPGAVRTPSWALSGLPVHWRGQVEAAVAANPAMTGPWLAVAAVLAAHPNLSSTQLRAWWTAPAAALVRGRIDSASRVSRDGHGDEAAVPRQLLDGSGDALPGELKQKSGDMGPAPSPAARHAQKSVDGRGPALDGSELLPPASELIPPSSAAGLTDAPARSTSWYFSASPQPTEYAGLLFLLRPLARLGLPAQLERHPELVDAEFGRRLLTAVATDLEVPENDPVVRAVAPLAEPREVPGLDVSEWSEDWKELWTAAHPRPPLSDYSSLLELLRWWQVGLAAYVERVAGMSLAELVHRPAAIACSRTHVELIFDLEASDLAIRKAALDIDPGFVPWFHRVVQYHYVVGGIFDA